MRPFLLELDFYFAAKLKDIKWPNWRLKRNFHVEVKFAWTMHQFAVCVYRYNQGRKKANASNE